MGRKEDEWLGVWEIPGNCWELQKELTRDARVVFDVGAHHGRVAGRYLEMFPNAIVYAFEPEKQNFRNMLKRLPKLRGGNKRVKPFCVAVSDYVGTTPFHIAGVTVAHSVFGSTKYHPVPVKTISVPVITLDSFCSEHRIGRIDLLKIDVEGAELQVFKGASRLLVEDRIGLIYTEMLFYPHFEGGCEAWEIAAFLNEYGWGLHGFWGQGTSGHRILGGDAIFVKRKKLADLPKSKR